MKKQITLVISVLVLALTLACGSTPQVRTVQPSGATEVSVSTTEPGVVATEMPAPTIVPTTAPLGSARSNPAPLGTEVDIGSFTLSIGEVVRPANARIAEANTFNSDPEPGNEYLMLVLNATCNKGFDESCSIAPIYETSLVGSTGVIREPEIFIAGIDNMFESGEMFGGVTLTGWLVFEVAEGETDLILIYEDFLGRNKAYLAISQ